MNAAGDEARNHRAASGATALRLLGIGCGPPGPPALPLLLVLFSILPACGSSFRETPPPAPAEFPGEEARSEGGTAERLRNAAQPTYRVYVANEASDDVSLVAFTPGEGAEVEKTIPVGTMPGDIDGAHGITVSPDGSRWYVSIAHGTPNGSLWQFATGADTLLARTELGRFPATMGISSDGTMIFVVNFNLHGDPVPSDVSAVYTPSMTPLSRIPTCVRPHGSRVNVAGTVHYSGCTGSDQVVAIDTRRLEVATRFSVVPGREGVLPLSNTGEERTPAGSAESDTTGIDRIAPAPDLQRRCSPTWVEPARGVDADRLVYVACNQNGEVLSVSTDSWEVVDRLSTGPRPYNMEITPDGRYLLVTRRTDEGGLVVFDLDADGEEVARLETSESLSHGVVASSDDRYAFVTNEAVGSTRGTLDVFDLQRMERVASVTLGHQSGGIDFWEIQRFGR